MTLPLPVVPTNQIEVAVTTETKPTSVERYLVEFREFSLKTSLSIIESANVVYQAKMSLKADGQYDQFCLAIGRKSKSSFIRKFEQIGRQAELFRKYSSTLPNTWTSLHTLIQLADNVLEKLLEDGIINPNTTGAEIKQLITEHNPPKVSANKSVKKSWYKYELPCDVQLSESDQLKLDGIIANFIKCNGKVCPVDDVHATDLKETGSEILAEPLAA